MPIFILFYEATRLGPLIFLCVRASVLVCARARARVCQSKRDRERDEGGCMYVCVWMCGRRRYGVCGCEGGQDENSDYTCAEYIAY